MWADILPHCKMLLVLAKEAVKKVGQQMKRCSGGGNGGRCQGPEETVITKGPQNLAVSSHVKAPVREGKPSGLLGGQEVQEKCPHDSSIDKKEKKDRRLCCRSW